MTIYKCRNEEKKKTQTDSPRKHGFSFIRSSVMTRKLTARRGGVGYSDETSSQPELRSET